MSVHRPWFSVMASEKAGRPGSKWVKVDAASLGRVVVRPITAADQVMLANFALGWLAATLVIWLWGVHSGTFSVAFGILATVLIAALLVAGFIRLVCAQMTERSPRRNQSR